MTSRILRALLLAGVLAALAAAPPSSPPKRAITHDDYASWRSIQSPTLSPDGNQVAFAIAPQDGDGEFVLRQLATGKEFRHTRGNHRAPNLPPRPGQTAPTVAATRFSPDGKFVIFPIYASKQQDKSKQPGGTTTPTTGIESTSLGIMETASGKVASVERVRSYQVSEEGTAWLAYLRSLPPAKDDTKPKLPIQPTTPTPTPAELVLRRLPDGQERTFADVSEFRLTKDGRSLVYAVQSKTEKDNGVWTIIPGEKMEPVALRTGQGKFSRLTWDEKQTQLVFYHTITAKAEKQGEAPKSTARIFHWSRPTMAMPNLGGGALGGLTFAALQNAQAIELTAAKPVFRDGHTISDQATLIFSPDGSRVYFGVSAPPAKREPQSAPAVELWHYKDEFIQPMQKVRTSPLAKTYRAVYDLRDKIAVQLAHEAIGEVAPARAGEVALGTDDRPYRRLVGSEAVGSPTDLYLVNQKTGESKVFHKKSVSMVAMSPGGKHVILFDGKHWLAGNTGDGKKVNLTGKLKARFDNEQHDTPGEPSPYGFAGWTKDDQHVLLYDRYDIWAVTPDGVSAKNLTSGLGRKSQIQFRVVRLGEEDRTLDVDKPLLLRAENEVTRDTGFYRVGFDGASPKMLVMGPCNYSTPVKATKGDRLLFTCSTFYDYPDLYTADLDFREVKRISHANPQKSKLLWGKAELISYKNSDGVPLQGMLVKPENFDPKKKYPMIVYIYERLSQNVHRFVPPAPGTSINPTYYASNGYVVFMPDIVYTVGQPGQSAVKCVLPAIQAVVDQGYIDEKAIGIQGHSWGGYQTAYLVTQTTRFAAASAGAPVSNMTSAYGGIRWGTGLPRQFQYEKTQSRIGATLWQGRDKFIENSPLFMADRVKTPLLMLHNDQDEAVPWQQGIEYYLALRRLNKEVYMFNYRGEGHGLRQRANQEDYTRRMAQFFDFHLKKGKKPDWMEKGIAYAPPPATQGTQIPRRR